MKGALRFAVIGESLTGLALLGAPSLIGKLLLGVYFTGVAVPIARVAGIALMGLAIACVPGQALLGMLTYSMLVMLYLCYIGFTGSLIGVLLWPAVVLHAVLVVLLARSWLKAKTR